jgi:hypothetical protein
MSGPRTFFPTPCGLPTGRTSCSYPATRLPPGCTGSAWGSGKAKRLTEVKLSEVPIRLPVGKRLAFTRQGTAATLTHNVCRSRSRAGALGVRFGKPELFLGTPFDEIYLEFSPDGRWLAYASNESGTYEVYVRPFPGPLPCTPRHVHGSDRAQIIEMPARAPATLQVVVVACFRTRILPWNAYHCQSAICRQGYTDGWRERAWQRRSVSLPHILGLLRPAPRFLARNAPLQ